MLNYLKAENLKCKKSFLKKLIIIAPLITLLFAYLSGRYYIANGYNWWYTILLPGFVTLIAALTNQLEDKKLRYRAVYSIPVSLQKTWTAKVLLIIIYTSAANLVLLFGTIIGKITYNTSSDITVPQMILAVLVLIITSIWQIPLCLFLSKQFGLLITILLNVGGGVVLGIITVTKSIWWICPYSWGMRLMCPVLGLLPNGLMTKAGDPLLNQGVLPVGIVLSIVLFIVLLAATTLWFPKQEVK